MTRKIATILMTLVVGTLSLAVTTAAPSSANRIGEAGAGCPGAPGAEEGWSCKIWVKNGDGDLYVEGCWIQVRNAVRDGRVIGYGRAVCNLRPTGISVQTETSGDLKPQKFCAGDYSRWRNTDKWVCYSYEVSQNNPPGSQVFDIVFTVIILDGFSIHGPTAGQAQGSPFVFERLH